jgi:hypothetical protein
VRGPQKAPTKTQVTLRLDARVVEHFQGGRRGLADPHQRRLEEGGGDLKALRPQIAKCRPSPAFMVSLQETD